MEPRRSETMIALRAAKQAVNIARDIDWPGPKFEPPTVSLEKIRALERRSLLNYVPRIIVMLPHALREDEIAPRWLVIFLSFCLILVVGLIVFAAVHYH